jgi:ADP-dependent NAD(P)H-hydrate dehydratase
MILVDSELLRTMPLPQHHGNQDKDQRGQALIVGGCTEVPGGVRLAAEAALRAGAGKLQIATCASIAVPMGIAIPEALVMALAETPSGCIGAEAADAVVKRAQRADAVLVGPGMPASDDTAGFAAGLLRTVDNLTAVLDAGALAGLLADPGSTRRHAGRMVLTPHAGEMAKLMNMDRGGVEADPLEVARRAAAAFQAVVVMKGPQTHIVSPQGQAWLFQDGTVGLAISGSGDVLGGIITGLLARGATPTKAALWGVWLHGHAGQRLMQRHGLGFLARELPAEIPRLMAEQAAPD